ncbi:MAG: aryl-sulfate sulfotransferase [Rhodospirillaceae bacterium]|nr:aryl-sulfate sulfotransferase [Rhodospirillaceae bacterium]MDD9929302.1 aryl-sulfate sulfotransferase [Rhodospirillaceae bacterium]
MKHYRTGLLHHQPEKTCPGYTVIAPMRHEASYLVDMEGTVAHTWNLPGPLGSKAYLLPNGNLLCSIVTAEGVPIPGAKGGHILELDWNGNVVWDHLDHSQHHDLVRLANGNTVYLSREALDGSEAAEMIGGVLGTEINETVFGDVIREVDAAGDLVWEWYFKDADFEAFPLAADCHRGEWAHANSVAPTLDGNLLISFRHLDTIVIVDRKTKDIVWHKRDQSWGHQHNADMLPNGNITLFANGMNNLYQPLHSRALEIDPETGETVWDYVDPQKWTFFSPVMSGIQRLANGNSLICEALSGRVFEVDGDGEIVWDYIAPMHHPNPVLHGPSNALFRAYRYAPGSAEISNRL